MRSLASIQRIDNLYSIQGADRIEVAQILGWECVVKKGEFKVGDKCIFFEVDSVLPNKPEFEFMAEKKYRVRTIKLRKQISQGLVIPLSYIKYADLSIYNIGYDVTSLLGVVKYDPEIRRYSGTGTKLGFKRTKGKFPYFIPKTDEERIQSSPHFLRKYKDELFYISSKLDGCSGTFYVKNKKYGICSRNLELMHDEDLSKLERFKRYIYSFFSKSFRKALDIDRKSVYSKVSRQFKIREKLLSLNRNIAIQGELIGPSIQGNKYVLNSLDFRVFNIYHIDKQKFCSYNELIYITTQLELNTVPILKINESLDNYDIPKLVELSKGKSILNPKIMREGVVFRTMKESDSRISFKVINPEFLLKYEGEEDKYMEDQVCNL